MTEKTRNYAGKVFALATALGTAYAGAIPPSPGVVLSPVVKDSDGNVTYSVKPGNNYTLEILASNWKLNGEKTACLKWNLVADPNLNMQFVQPNPHYVNDFFNNLSMFTLENQEGIRGSNIDYNPLTGETFREGIANRTNAVLAKYTFSVPAGMAPKESRIHVGRIKALSDLVPGQIDYDKQSTSAKHFAVAVTHPTMPVVALTSATNVDNAVYVADGYENGSTNTYVLEQTADLNEPMTAVYTNSAPGSFLKDVGVIEGNKFFRARKAE